MAILAVTSSLAACTVRETSESSAAECTNGRDDDRDGHVDCDDQDCDAVCSGGGDDAAVVNGDAGGGGNRDAAGGCFAPIDLVFVLDVSTSMSEEFARLRDGIGSIFAAADALTPDHRFGLVVFVDDVLVVNSCASFDTAAALQSEFDQWRSFCSTNGNPGGALADNSDCPENSLDALYAAATQCTWRAGATHIVIHATDDTFLEAPQRFAFSVAAQHTYAEVSTALTTSQIRVGAFAQLVPMECGAGTSADTATGFFGQYEAQASLPDATGGRVWDIAQVRNGTLDMATAINEMIVAEHCAPF